MRIFILVFCLLYFSCSLLHAQYVLSPEKLIYAKYFDAIVGKCEKCCNRGPQIDSIFFIAGFNPGVAWCSITHIYCFKKAKIKLPKNVNGFASSWFVQERVIKESEIQMFDFGAIWNPYMNRIGHVLIIRFHKKGKDFFTSGEGNTNSKGSREGSCVRMLTRKIKQVHTFARYLK